MSLPLLDGWLDGTTLSNVIPQWASKILMREVTLLLCPRGSARGGGGWAWIRETKGGKKKIND